MEYIIPPKQAQLSVAIKGLDNLGNYVEKIMTTFNLEEESGVDLFCCFVNYNSCIETLYMYIIMTNLHKKGKAQLLLSGTSNGKKYFFSKAYTKRLAMSKE